MDWERSILTMTHLGGASVQTSAQKVLIKLQVRVKANPLESFMPWMRTVVDKGGIIRL